MAAWIIDDPQRTNKILDEIGNAPVGSRVTLDVGPIRTSAQNRLMWHMLNCFAEQYEHQGRYYNSATWKSILMNAFGKEIEFVPSLDGETIVGLGYRSSLLTVEEMANFVEFIGAEGTRRGISFERRDDFPFAAQEFAQAEEASDHD
jgi:hypothetical protein